MSITSQNKINIEELLAQGNTVKFHPMGTSMWPLFVSQEDYAIVNPVKENQSYKRGMVCLYRGSSGNLVLHRIYKVKKDGVYFVGDHQTQIEGPLPISSLKGILVAFERKGQEYSSQNLGYRLLSRLWLCLRPFRWTLIHLGSRLKSILHS